MKHPIFSLLAFLLMLPLQAQNRRLDKPLQYISADSVFTWAYSGSDFRQTALKAEPNTQTYPFAANQRVMAVRNELLEQWQSIVPELNIVGGGDDPLRDPQGVPSAVGVSLAAHLFLLTGDASYAHFMERTVFNAAGRTLADSTLQAGNKERRSAAEVFMAVPSLLYATTADRSELYVNLYTNATATLHLAGQTFTFDQITEMPEVGRIKFRFSNLKGELPLKVHLRLPDWVLPAPKVASPYALPYTFAGNAPEGLMVYVNGHEVDSVKPDAQGYLCIDRTWQRYDEIFIEFPLVPRFLRHTGADGTARRGELALQNGPRVYVMKNVPAEALLSVNALPTYSSKTDEAGNTLLEGTAFCPTLSTPQDAEAPRITYLAAPYESGAQGAVWVPEFGAEVQKYLKK